MLRNITLPLAVIGFQSVANKGIADIYYDPGGYVAARAQDISTTPAERIVGICMSACTMEMLTGCVAPTARLVFHLPNPDTPHWRDVMRHHYPDAIANWFATLPAGSAPHEMIGAEAIRLGARPCPTFGVYTKPAR